MLRVGRLICMTSASNMHDVGMALTRVLTFSCRRYVANSFVLSPPDTSIAERREEILRLRLEVLRYRIVSG